jgi:hypothetical protein
MDLKTYSHALCSIKFCRKLIQYFQDFIRHLKLKDTDRAQELVAHLHVLQSAYYSEPRIHSVNEKNEFSYSKCCWNPQAEHIFHKVLSEF